MLNEQKYFYKKEKVMTKVFLIRHGVTDSNAERRIQGSINIPLNDMGLAQATLLGRRFENITLDKIYSSPLSRALQTAEQIRLVKGLPIICSDGLKELDCGILEGKTYAENQKLYPEQMRLLKDCFSKFTPPGGESVTELYRRMVDTVTSIVSNNKCKTLAIVSHGLAIQAYIGFLKNTPADALMRSPIKNTSVTCITYNENLQGTILSFNDVSHLPEALHT